MAGTGEEFGPCPFCGKLHPEDVLLCPDSEKLLALEGRILDGKFRFTRQLGEGGMGAVWRCENILVKKDVAIKLMHIQFSRDEGVLARFRNEATAAGRIGSEHICDILDLGKSTLGPYIVMEMLQGKDLANFLQEKRGQVDPGLSVLIMREALIGLQAAHNVGIVHRDLKPENIFLHEPKPGRLMVKLMDFGISKFTEGSEAGKTGMGVLMGTPEYMSPEQTEGAAQVDHRTDIWAMGVILYWAVTGRNPFAGPTMAATLVNVSTKPPPPLAQVAPHVDPNLVAIIDRCIAKSPDDRFNSCEELSAALQPFEKRDNGIYRVMSEAPRSGPPKAGATIASSPSNPPPGATIASQHTPMPTPGTPPPGAPTFGSPNTGPGASPTWSGGMTGPPGSAPTIGTGAGTGFGLSERELDMRPDTNISGGGKGMMILIVLLLVAG
ncbi:MAG: serine/threonine-protein kinase, partial [Myxococcota bacterium]